MHRSRWIYWAVALSILTAALALYVGTLSHGAYPGASAQLAVERTGLVPVVLPRHPLWNACVWVVAKIPVGAFALRLNLFSAVCGALTVLLLYRTVSVAVWLLIEETTVSERRAVVAGQLAGVAAAGFLMLSIPFWVVSNRTHTGAFDLLLLIGCARLLLRYFETGRFREVLLLVLLYAVGLAEFATLIVFAPLLAFAIVYCLWSHESLRPGPLAILTVVFLAGVSTYFLAAWSFYGSFGYTLREYEGFFEIVWQMWRAQYALITSSLPREGWLIILFVAVAPWLAALWVARRGMNDERDRGSALLHIVLTVLALAMLFNSRFSPWAMLGSRRLLVTPYLLSASLYGYLVAYWFLLPSRWFAETGRPVVDFVRRWGGVVLCLPLLGCLVWAGVRNLPEANARRGEVVDVYAGHVVDSLAGRTWLVTDGVLDDHLLLAAYERDIPLRLINASPFVNSVYLKYVAGMFDDPQLKNLASLGTLPLLTEWMSTDPKIADKLAVLDAPDLWGSAGFVAAPSGLVYFGHAAEATLDIDVVARQRDLWEYMEGMRDQGGELPTDLRRYVDEFLRHVGVLANNLGVALEGEKRDVEAEACYRRARRIAPDNVSALLNLAVMVQQGRAKDADGSIRREMDRLAEESKGRYRIWSLSKFYGYVRMPEAFADLGWAWAQSGQPALARVRMKQALAIAGDENRAGLRRMMAGVLLMQGEADESAALLERLVADNPQDVRSLLGLARAELRRGAFDAAAALLSRAEQAGAGAIPLVYERARLDLARGQPDIAQAALASLQRERSEDPELWALLAEAALAKQDAGRAGDYVARLEQIEGPRGFRGSILRGRLALVQSDLDGARRNFEIASQLRPNNVPLLDLLLRISVGLRQNGAAWHYTREILKRDRQHAYALHMLGLLRVAENRLDLAEAALKSSLEQARTPAVLNDLAWVLCLREQYGAAEALVRESLKQDENNFAYQDTLGMVLLRTGRYVEAAVAFEKALALCQFDPGIYLRMAECQAQLGNRDRAQALLNAIVPYLDSLSADDRAQLATIRRLLEP